MTILSAIILNFAMALQEEPPHQPHTNEPGECTRYCHPPGYEGAKPRGTPEGIPGYECEGDRCARAGADEDPEGENMCEESVSCTSHCAKVCCTCLAVCM